MAVCEAQEKGAQAQPERNVLTKFAVRLIFRQANYQVYRTSFEPRLCFFVSYSRNHVLSVIVPRIEKQLEADARKNVDAVPDDQSNVLHK